MHDAYVEVFMQLAQRRLVPGREEKSRETVRAFETGWKVGCEGSDAAVVRDGVFIGEQL